MAVFACCKNAKFTFHILPDGQHRFQQKFSLSIEISFKVVALGVGLHVADEVLERGQAHRPQVDGHHGADARKEPLDLEVRKNGKVCRYLDMMGMCSKPTIAYY